MNINKTALSIVFAGLCAVAIFTGIWGFLTASGAVAGLVAAVILLVAAQLLLVFVLADNRTDEDKSAVLEDIYARLDDIDQQITRLSRLRQVPAPATPPALPEPTVPIVADLSKSTNPASYTAQPDINQPDDSPHYLQDQRLFLYLEPVVELETMNTAFYRAELALKTDLGERIRLSDEASDIACEIADGGYSAAVDMKLFNKLGPVIDRLAEKGRLAGVICPMSQHSFSNQPFLEELTRYLKHYPELARVLVIEISQANLANLSQDGMAGLAFLAQIGATFCLGGAGLESPDLDSLSSLGFRYLDLDFTDNVERYSLQAFGTTGAAAQLRDQALGVGIQLIGSGLIRKSQSDALNHVIKFGRGMAFSAPRLVRSDFTNLVMQTKAA